MSRGISLPTRQDVKHEAPTVTQLPPPERALMATSNAWRASHYASLDWKRADTKYRKLDALLSDPALLIEIPADNEERIEAESRASALYRDRLEAKTLFRTEAMRFERAWAHLPLDEQTTLGEAFTTRWSDSPCWELVQLDPLLPHAPAWKRLLARWKSLSDEEKQCPPF